LKTHRSVIILLAVVVSLSLTLSAKRAPPQPVAPVFQNNVKYSAAGDGRTGIVIASDASSGKELWRVEIFRVDYNPRLEEDVQDVYITELKLEDNRLLVKDEKLRCYLVDLSTRRVKRKLLCF